LRAGAWVVPINPIYTAAEIRHQVHDSGARFLVTLPERSGELAGAAENVEAAGTNCFNAICPYRRCTSPQTIWRSCRIPAEPPGHPRGWC
jgi:acyl-CoA synthetase (AMP-forming)/AMP-acid ligase II